MTRQKERDKTRTALKQRQGEQLREDRKEWKWHAK
jgi:hypothetical protein